MLDRKVNGDSNGPECLEHLTLREAPHLPDGLLQGLVVLLQQYAALYGEGVLFAGQLEQVGGGDLYFVEGDEVLVLEGGPALEVGEGGLVGAGGPAEYHGGEPLEEDEAVLHFLDDFDDAWAAGRQRRAFSYHLYY